MSGVMIAAIAIMTGMGVDATVVRPGTIADESVAANPGTDSAPRDVPRRARPGGLREEVRRRVETDEAPRPDANLSSRGRRRHRRSKSHFFPKMTGSLR
jgi:hypothetical protein